MERASRTRLASDPSDLSEAPRVPAARIPLGPGAVRDRAGDRGLGEPLPDAERLLAEAVALAGDDLDSARLVRRYWRFAADEELVGLTPDRMLSDAREHREL